MNKIRKEHPVIYEIIAELERAKEKHPNWPWDLLHQIAIINEEAGEATKATLQWKYENGSKMNITHELISTAAMCIRMIESMEKRAVIEKLKEIH